MGFKPIYLLAQEVKKEIQSRGLRPEFPTGFQELDDLIWGLRREDVIIVAGRTSHGKSDFLINMAWNLAQEGKPVWMMPIEMSAKAVTERLFCRDSMIPNSEFRRGKWDDEAERKFTVFVEKLKQFPIEIYEGYGVTTDTVVGVIDQYKPEIIFIDHAQMISKGANHKDKKEAIDDMMRRLKVIALERRVIVVIGSQFNRGDTRNPGLENLKGSGELEELSDVVMRVFWPHKDWLEHQEEDEPNKNEYHVTVLKNRHGPGGHVLFCYEPQYSKVYSEPRNNDGPTIWPPQER